MLQKKFKSVASSYLISLSILEYRSKEIRSSYATKIFYNPMKQNTQTQSH